MAKVVKKGVKPTTKKATATTKATAKKAVAKKATAKNAYLTTAQSKKLKKTPVVFKAGRSMDKIAKDLEHKAKVAKMSENGKWYVEYKGKDGKKHREYRANRLDYKFGI